MIAAADCSHPTDRPPAASRTDGRPRDIPPTEPILIIIRLAPRPALATPFSFAGVHRPLIPLRRSTIRAMPSPLGDGRGLTGAPCRRLPERARPPHGVGPVTVHTCPARRAPDVTAFPARFRAAQGTPASVRSP